ncbi:uncharacterized protein [Clytia hemisphaerica]|uniref:Potassium channel domain-containing protein n=1 Tax=Clytia hemisphaerica TaxID=252671 RepID=A0A7M5X2I2_9CNID
MMVLVTLLFSSILTLVTSQLHNKKICEHLEVFSVDRCHYLLDEKCSGKPIKNESIPCRFNFDIAKINNKPFSTTYFLDLIQHRLIDECCGCVDQKIAHEYDNTSDFLHSLENRTHEQVERIIFPFYGDTTRKVYHGLHFLPLYYLEEAVLISVHASDSEKMEQLVFLVLSLWPLFLVCIMLACTAGFIMWLMETWGNRIDFRRPFLQGFFDGFWWGFVSMTTVGYGDKVPRSIQGRLFSVIWITMGITICSLLTAAMTDSIKAVEEPATVSLAHEIGILKGRIFETKLVIHGGGLVKEFDTPETLVDELWAGSVKGVVMDLPSKYVLFIDAIKKKGFSLDNFDIKVIRSITKNVYAYGVLFRDQIDMEFFEEIIHNHATTGDLCLAIRYDSTKKITRNTSIFHVDSGVFWPTFASVWSVISVFMLFGLLYEWRRRRYLKKKGAEKTGMNHDMKEEKQIQLPAQQQNKKQMRFAYDNSNDFVIDNVTS